MHMAAPSKQKFIDTVLERLAAKYECPLPQGLKVLDHLVLGILQEGTSFTEALRGYKRLLTNFHDVNEIRVSHPHEIEEALVDLAHKEVKARRLLHALQYVFEITYTFDLESMRRKPIKQAQKQIGKIHGVNDFVLGAVVQRALGGHALPIDQAMVDMLTEVGLVEPGVDVASARAGLESAVAKAKGIDFCLLVSHWAADIDGRDEIVMSLKDSPGLLSLADAAPAKTATKAPAKKKAQ